jgi:hypothetical protein
MRPLLQVVLLCIVVAVGLLALIRAGRIALNESFSGNAIKQVSRRNSHELSVFIDSSVDVLQPAG